MMYDCISVAAAALLCRLPGRVPRLDRAAFALEGIWQPISPVGSFAFSHCGRMWPGSWQTWTAPFLPKGILSGSVPPRSNWPLRGSALDVTCSRAPWSWPARSTGAPWPPAGGVLAAALACTLGSGRQETTGTAHTSPGEQDSFKSWRPQNTQ